MSYHKRYRQRARAAMGDLTSTLNAAVDVASDPYLPEIVCRIQQLKQVAQNQPVQQCTDTPDSVPGGLGLRNAMPVLRGYVYAQQNPWVYPVAILAVLGLPFVLGFELGRSR